MNLNYFTLYVEILLIKGILMLNAITRFVCRMLKVVQLILKGRQLISNSLLINEMPLLNIIMKIVCRQVNAAN
jgi:hypothetical protein